VLRKYNKGTLNVKRPVWVVLLGKLGEFGTKIHRVFQGVFEDFNLGDFEACESGLGNETETNETVLGVFQNVSN
jgi:hypothetical protein